jgi:trimethylamine--corrinoid protein Co-methyltransferase
MKDMGFQCVPEYRILSESQIERLHHGTLEILETVGVKVFLPEAVAMMADAGCRVFPDGTVRIPAQLVEDCIHSAPSSIRIYNRLGHEAMRLEGRRVHFGLGTDLLKTYDLETGELRNSCLNDVANASRIADALENIDFTASYALPQQGPANMMYIDCFRAQLENTVKPIFFTAAGKDDLAVIHAMAATAVGGESALVEKPIHIHYSEPLSPLAHTAGSLKKLFFCADHRIPVTYTPGATAPTTLAGAIVTGNAEALSGIVLHQLRSKGAPIISGFGTATFDMKTCICVYGSPEYRLALSACADLYHHYGIPMWGTAGASDAHVLDQQATMEWSVSLLTAGLDGANLIHDVGYLGQGKIAHPAGLVICDEIIGYIKRFLKGFSIDDGHMDLDAIQHVGPMGNFLGCSQTFRYFRSEYWQPKLTSRMPLHTWLEGNADILLGRAASAAMDILKNHAPEPLSETQRNTLDHLRCEAERSLAGKIIEA